MGRAKKVKYSYYGGIPGEFIFTTKGQYTLTGNLVQAWSSDLLDTGIVHNESGSVIRWRRGDTGAYIQQMDIDDIEGTPIWEQTQANNVTIQYGLKWAAVLGNFLFYVGNVGSGGSNNALYQVDLRNGPWTSTNTDGTPGATRLVSYGSRDKMIDVKKFSSGYHLLVSLINQQSSNLPYNMKFNNDTGAIEFSSSVNSTALTYFGAVAPYPITYGGIASIQPASQQRTVIRQEPSGPTNVFWNGLVATGTNIYGRGKVVEDGLSMVYYNDTTISKHSLEDMLNENWTPIWSIADGFFFDLDSDENLYVITGTSPTQELKSYDLSGSLRYTLSGDYGTILGVTKLDQ